MIRFEALEAAGPALAEQFRTAKPFSFVAIDDFCDAGRLNALVDQLPDANAEKLNKSRDYVFAKNKFEKSGFRELGPLFQEVYDELVSPRFAQFLKTVTGDELFVDPEFHGGGIHQGGEGSFLDMHADFNYHPLHDDWFRNLNILLYLNRDWKPEYGGSLKLRHKDTGAATEVEPLFNRCVIMHTRGYTLHGYDPISFPPGAFRRSIATYAYSPAEETHDDEARSTTWYPERGSLLKRALGRSWPTLVAVKSRLLGSGTARNR